MICSKIDTLGIKPTITPKDVKLDEEVATVADPFIVHHNNKFFLFYEVLTKKKKVIGISTSLNGKDYEWLGIVLDESVNNILLSFPYTFRYENNWYMIPEQSETNTGRSLNYLYKTDNESFPFGWKKEGVLFDFKEKRKISDKVIIRHNGMWYVFYGLGDSRKHKLNIAIFENLKNRKARKHPASPIIQTPANNPYSQFIFYLNIIGCKFKKRGFDINKFPALANFFSKLGKRVTHYPCRPGGSIIKNPNGEITLYLQYQGAKLDNWDIRKSHSRYVSKITISKLTPEEIEFQIHDDYVVAPTLKEDDWNADKMHTVCPIEVDGETFTAVDGWNESKKEWSIAVINKTNNI